VVENILPGYYSGNMAGVHTDLTIMKQLLVERRPDISGKVEGLGIPLVRSHLAGLLYSY
jgi:hypothetical protein